jgi:long-chain fatty acid transport protein
MRTKSTSWAVGIGAAALTGASIDYGETWAGRYQAQKVDLLGIAAIPAVSWQATEKLSLGLGLPILYTKLKQDLAIPNLSSPVLGPDGQARLKGDDTNIGVQVQAIYGFTDRTRLGAMYMSKFDQKMDGDIDFDLPAGGAGSVTTDTKLPFPQMVRIGLGTALTDKSTLYLGAGWENWSDLNSIVITGEANSASVPVGWKDTWHGAVGYRYLHPGGKLSQGAGLGIPHRCAGVKD